MSYLFLIHSSLNGFLLPLPFLLATLETGSWTLFSHEASAFPQTKITALLLLKNKNHCNWGDGSGVRGFGLIPSTCVIVIKLFLGRHNTRIYSPQTGSTQQTDHSTDSTKGQVGEARSFIGVTVRNRGEGCLTGVEMIQ